MASTSIRARDRHAFGGRAGAVRHRARGRGSRRSGEAGRGRPAGARRADAVPAASRRRSIVRAGAPRRRRRRERGLRQPRYRRGHGDHRSRDRAARRRAGRRARDATALRAADFVERIVGRAVKPFHVHALRPPSARPRRAASTDLAGARARARLVRGRQGRDRSAWPGLIGSGFDRVCGALYGAERALARQARSSTGAARSCVAATRPADCAGGRASSYPAGGPAGRGGRRRAAGGRQCHAAGARPDAHGFGLDRRRMLRSGAGAGASL